MIINNKNISYTQWCIALYREITAKTHKPEEASPPDWFWVIDACAHPELPGILWQLDSSPDACALYMSTFMEEAMQSGPWFMPCNVESSTTQWLFNQLEKVPLGFLLSVPRGGGDEMYEHLQNLLECTFSQAKNSQPHEKKAGLFRFYDPRILYGLTTFYDSDYINLVKGPALSLHAWEPGRSIPLTNRYTTDQKNFCTGTPQLPKSLIDHLWKENQVHTIIATLDGDPGVQLRSMPLPEAYEYVDGIRNKLKNSPYISNTDVSFITAYSLLSLDEEWKEVLEQITLTQFLDCSTLDIALEKSFAAREKFIQQQTSL